MLKLSFKKYFFRLLVFVIILTSITVGLQQLWPQYAAPALPFILLFVFLVTLFTHYLILRGIYNKDQRRMVSNYMLATIIKFMSYLIFILVYLLLTKQDKILFAITFLIVYFLFALFEIFAIKREDAK
ncbi:MAG: hypothetical protein IJU33_02000 [Bacteroidales bacterium]|nr:hypothetical protein [Bacteroidales bacterium]